MCGIKQSQYIKRGWDYRIVRDDNKISYYFEIKRSDDVYECHQLCFSNDKNLEMFLMMLDNALKIQNRNLILNEIGVIYDDKPTKSKRM